MRKSCTNKVCGKKLMKFAYWVGRDGPLCKMCAQFIGHVKGIPVDRKVA